MDLPLPHSLPKVAVAPAAPADPNAVVDSDFPCRKCSYNLRGLTYGGRCPECGTPVGLSTVGDLLRYSDPNWLGTLSRGSWIMLWGIAISFSAGAINFLRPREPALNSWIMVAASLVGLFGSWLVTERDPSGLGEEQYATSRRLVRVSLGVTLVSELIFAMTEKFHLPQPIRFAVDMIGVGLILFHAIGEVALFVYFRKLSLRIPDEAFAGRAKFLAWALGVTSIFSALIGGILLLIDTFGISGVNIEFIGGSIIISWLAYMIFGIMKVLFLLSLRKTLAEQAAMSRRIWKVMQE